MSFLELFVLAVGLSMDAFAVSVCKGLASRRAGLREMATAGLWFGAFQMLMPLAGWALGSRFREYIERVDHWVAFALLAAIGLNMVREAFSAPDGGKPEDASFSAKVMLPLAVATSIDALAAGISLGLLLGTRAQVIAACTFIGTVTLVLSAAGVKTGATFGNRFEKKAKLAGGILLVGIGTKILLEHLGIPG